MFFASRYRRFGYGRGTCPNRVVIRSCILSRFCRHVAALPCNLRDFEELSIEHGFCVFRLSKPVTHLASSMMLPPQVDERFPWEHVTDEAIASTPEGFLGDIMQVPPIYSALQVRSHTR